MKKKMILLLVLSMLALQACTVRILTPTYDNAGTGQQNYSVQTLRFGPALPVITVINPYRQMSRR